MNGQDSTRGDAASGYPERYAREGVPIITHYEGWTNGLQRSLRNETHFELHELD